jgi:hypothetical protein
MPYIPLRTMTCRNPHGTLSSHVAGIWANVRCSIQFNSRRLLKVRIIELETGAMCNENVVQGDNITEKRWRFIQFTQRDYGDQRKLITTCADA